ncbi:YdeI/OmpD-associated family protein [Kineosporia sp. NBRC 101731]|uniref:YdeI/OmpD-associated family protein n=1 Tax=Kineosporia sp. NBRC 101731 TaxID=3032199 RepID=UPI0024A1BD48|nr:YdeI/OmpD-associated family protein [Kineosporia sp. NBRC 101731]GLY30391.1 hypothetical protein Kisp02_37560 [Kineosporia sp. NBRC 101731]
MSETFQGELVCEQVGAWTYVTVPPEVARRLGVKSRLPVRGEVAGAERAGFTGSVMSGPAGHYIVVNQAVRAAAGVRAGDEVTVTISPDAATRTVEVPDDLTTALAAEPAAHDFFDQLSYSRKKEYVSWITGAKQAQTRERRIGQAIEKLSARLYLK